jgi:hypothetical protein
MSHLEDLLCEYYEWQGYIVRRNVKVGRLNHGGWEGELDVVAYHPTTGDLLHLEPSIDALSWDKREAIFAKKFAVGRKYIFTDVFPWLDESLELSQIAVLTSGASRKELAGGEVITIDELASEIRVRIKEEGKMSSRAIPEQFHLLRTIQLITSGYYRKPESV